jgi:hypothetical protein
MAADRRIAVARRPLFVVAFRALVSETGLLEARER